MKSIKIIPATFFFLVFVSSAFSQEIHGSVKGEVKDSSPQPLIGASIYWSGTSTGTSSDVNGHFMLSAPVSYPARLMVSFIGYKTDTIQLDAYPDSMLSITLKNIVQLNEVEVTAREQSTQISVMNPIYAEKITTKELQKAACCNLSESFQTNTSVDVGSSDAVSGAKKVNMLGLDGVYSQIMYENLPYIRGLSSSYGLTYVPGTWIESIQINKGSGSVANGYESITGQINLEMRKPENAEKLFVNLYANHQGRAEANLHAAGKFGERWKSMLFLHTNVLLNRVDNNGDGFIDNPLKKHYNFFNRWKYQNDNMEAQFGVRGLTENIQSGQLKFDYQRDFGTTNTYGIGVRADQAELYGKLGKLFRDQPYKGLAVFGTSRIHRQSSYFGLKKYYGEQRSVFLNSVYQAIIGTTRHKFRTGVSYLLDDYNESYNDSAFSRTESVPGVYGEYTYDNVKRFSVVAGLRADYHNMFGMKLNPRLHVKYNITELTALRISGGRGFRVPNILVEHASVLASSRKVLVDERPMPEIAWNGGASITHKFKVLNREASVNADFFRTDFENQVVVDLETPQEVHFYNLQGKSWSNSFQAEFGIEPMLRLDVKIAYKWYDVKTTYNSGLLQRPLVPRDRALLNIAYSTKFDKWKFDLTVQWFGISRLPDTSPNPEEHRLSGYSKEYFVLNSQVTRSFKRIDVYLGGENLLNYLQDSPIIASDNPFSSYFDASLIWGPVMGRIVYGGLRYSIK